MVSRTFFNVLIVTKSSSVYAEVFSEGDAKHFLNNDKCCLFLKGRKRMIVIESHDTQSMNMRVCVCVCVCKVRIPALDFFRKVWENCVSNYP